MELSVEVIPEDLGAGAALKMGYHQYHNDLLESEDEDPRPVRSGAIHSQWFFEPSEGARVGAYHLANYGPGADADAWNPDGWEQGWTHEIGLFLSMTDSL